MNSRGYNEYVYALNAAGYAVIQVNLLDVVHKRKCVSSSTLADPYFDSVVVV